MKRQTAMPLEARVVPITSKHTHEPTLDLSKLPIFERGRIRFLDHEDILFCEADSNYCHIHLQNGARITTSKCLKWIEERLNSPNFYRTHASFIANLEHLRSFDTSPRSQIVVGEKAIPLSRRRVEQLRKLLNLHFLVIIINLAMGLMIAPAVNAQPVITSTSPAAYDHHVDKASNIIIYFSSTIDASTVNSNNIKVSGSMTGLLPGIFSGGGTSTITFNPDSSYVNGENISVTITTGITGGGIHLAKPYVLTFSVKPVAGSPKANSTGNIITDLADGASSIAAGDIDGDGDLDVLVGSFEDNKFAWHENLGAGSFSGHLVSNAGLGPSGVALADLDGDGDLDLLRATNQDHKITWFENDGNTPPGFSGTVISSTVMGIVSVSYGDMDGDGDIDILTASANDNKIAWFENNGAIPPSFTGNAITTSANVATSVTSADVDRDGDLDILATVGGEDQVNWYENNGAADPTFTEIIISGTMQGARDVTSGDMDGDGDLDVIAVSLLDDKLAWFENDGVSDPSFTGHVISLFGNQSNTLAVADIDSDGDLDVVRGSQADNTIAWFENDGEALPSFTGQVINNSANGVSDVTVADVNQDGDLDILSASYGDMQVEWYHVYELPRVTSFSPSSHSTNVSMSSQISIEFSIPIDGSSVSSGIIITGSQSGPLSGTFSGGGSNMISWTPANDLQPGERIDISVTQLVMSTDEAPCNPRVSDFIVESDLGYPGTVKNSITTSADEANHVIAGDLNGDGHIDLISASINNNTIAWYENDGSAFPTYASHVVTNTALDAQKVAVGDINGDGYMDIVAASSGDNTIEWFENDGTSTPSFTGHLITSSAMQARSVAVGDLDGDGDIDVASVSLGDNKTAWYENDGESSPTFETRVLSTTTMGAKDITIGDLDRDGDLDIITVSYNDDKLAWFENDGKEHPQFTGDAINFEHDGPVAIMAIDLNKDHFLDLIVSSGNDSTLAWYANNGAQNPGFIKHIISSSGVLPNGISAGDLDGDGDIDILRASTGADNIAWFENSGDPIPNFTGHVLAQGIDGAISTTIADLNNDGRLDFAVASNVDDEIAWFNALMRPVLQSSNPADLDVNVNSNANIELTFDTPMDPLSAHDGILIIGSISGILQGTYTANGNTLVFDPDSDYQLSEVIKINLNPSLLSSAGAPALSEYLQFEAYSGPGNLSSAGITGIIMADDCYSPYEPVVTDLNDDGLPDMVVPCLGENQIIWYQNLGNLEFTKRVVGSGATSISRIAIGDMDNDGNQDVVGCSSGGNAIRWYRSSGGSVPTFTTNLITAGASGVRDVIVADFDGDGDLDIASVSHDDESVRWFENDGENSPSFTTHLINDTEQYVQEIDAGDIDGDGDIDLVVIARLEYIGGAGGKVVWYRNNTDQQTSFERIFISQQTNSPRGLRLADIDADHHLDIFVTSSFESKIVWYKNNGNSNPSFSNFSYVTGLGDRWSHLVDVNSDGTVDCLTGSFDGEITLHIRDGSVWNSYTIRNPVDLTINEARITTADMDNDGLVDVVGALNGDHRINLYRGLGSLSFVESNPVSHKVDSLGNDLFSFDFTIPVNANSVNSNNIIVRGSQTGEITGSFSGGWTDRIHFKANQPLAPGEELTISITDGLLDGSIAQQPIVSPYAVSFVVASEESAPPIDIPGITIENTLGLPKSLYAADIDQDGDIDIACASSADNSLRWFQNQPQGGSFIEFIVADTLTSVQDIAIANINSDDSPDIVSVSPGDNKIRWFENDGNADPLFSGHVISDAATAASNVAVCDINSDGDPDIIYASTTQNTIRWLEHDGESSPSFSEHTVTNSALQVNSIATGDLDNDGDNDVIASMGGDNSVRWYENDGGAIPAFTMHPVSVSANGIRAISLGDMDQDGDLDIVRVCTVGASVAWYKNNGAEDPVFAGEVITLATDSVGAVLVCDVDGDLDLDIIYGSDSNDLINILLNDGQSAPSFTSQILSSGANDPTDLFFADLNNDHSADILATCSDDRLVWYESINAPHFLSITPNPNKSGVANDAEIEMVFDDNIDASSLVDTTFVVRGSFTGFIPGSLTGAGTNTITFHPDTNYLPGERIKISITSSVMSEDGWYILNPTEWSFETGSQEVPTPYYAQQLVTPDPDSSSRTVLADIDGDFDLDIVAISFSTDEVSWLENNGATHPEFERHLISTSADGPTDVCVGDINSDGLQDILVASRLDHKLVLYIQSIDTPGIFDSILISSLGLGISGIDIGDIDFDGDLDIVRSASIADNIAWFENDGSSLPGFTGHVIATELDSVIAIKIRDMNNDGFNDVVCSIEGQLGFTWFQHDGNPTPSFDPHTHANIQYTTSSMDIADYNNDRILDVGIITNDIYYISFGSEILQDGNVTYSFDGDYIPGIKGHITFGDLAGNGLSNIIIPKTGAGNNALYIESFGGGNAEIGDSITNSAFSSIGDLDGDGDLDIVTTSSSIGRLYWFETGIQRETLVKNSFGKLSIVDANGGNSNDLMHLTGTSDSLIITDTANTIMGFGIEVTEVDEHTVAIPVNQLSDIQVNTKSGIDTIYLSADLSILGGVSIAPVSQFTQLSGTLEAAGPVVAEATQIIIDGTLHCIRDSIVFDALRNIRINGTVSSDSADITIRANQQIPQFDGNFDGITIVSPGLITTASGTILLSGRGGNLLDSFLSNYGILINGGEIRTTGTSAGQIDLFGVGGAYTLNPAFGIYMRQFAGSSSRLAVRDGLLNIHGVTNPPTIPGLLIENSSFEVLGSSQVIID